MTTEAAIRAAMNYYARPAQAQPHVMPGAGEMVFHEHHPTTIRLLKPCLKQHLP